jgi:hypothetical protein
MAASENNGVLSPIPFDPHIEVPDQSLTVPQEDDRP